MPRRYQQMIDSGKRLISLGEKSRSSQPFSLTGKKNRDFLRVSGFNFNYLDKILVIEHFINSISSEYVIRLDLGIERCGVQAEEAGGAGLVAAGLFERATDHIDLEFLDLIIEINTSADVD